MASLDPAMRCSSRRRGVLYALVVLLLLSWCPPALFAQPPGGDIIYTRETSFWIPFEPISGERSLQEVRLNYSLDRGVTWKLFARALPNRRGFQFQTRQDGLHWFAVQTVDSSNRVFPPQLEGTTPGLMVFVDTQPPQISLQSIPTRDGQMGVEWQLRDEALDLNSLRLEYRVPGAPWQSLTVEPTAQGQRLWNPGTTAALEARLLVRDRAGNPAESTIPLNGGTAGNGSFNAGGLQGDPTGQLRGPGPNQPLVQMVNSKQINLNYEIEVKGKSGVSRVELFGTLDGRNWQKMGEDEDKTPPYQFTVPAEGLYGFTLVLRSGVDLGDRPPQTGDAPQMWVEVDLTKPTVKLQNVEVGRGDDKGKLSVSWTASDKNLRQDPITISFSENKESNEWKPIVKDHPNTGRFIWMMPEDVPHKFYLRVEAADRAGNVGTAEWNEVVKVDLIIPKAKILGVEPAGNK